MALKRMGIVQNYEVVLAFLMYNICRRKFTCNRNQMFKINFFTVVFNIYNYIIGLPSWLSGLNN